MTAENPQGPRAHAGSDQSVRGGGEVRLNGAGSSHPEGEMLSFAWRLWNVYYPSRHAYGPPDVDVRLNDPGSATPRFTAPRFADVPSNYQRGLNFILTVTDASGNVFSDFVLIWVRGTGPRHIPIPPNRSPVADAGPDQSVMEGATVMLDARSSSDPDGDALSFVWRGPFARRGPLGEVTLTDANTATPSFTAPTQLLSNRVFEFRLTVIDPSGLKSYAVVIITVIAVNDAPIANAGNDETVAEGATVRLYGLGSSDPENEAITFFEWTAPNDVTLNDAISATPSFTAPEQLLADRDLVFTLKVTDASGNVSAPDAVTITVTAGPNDRPIADAGPDQTVAEGATVTLAGVGSDPENEAVSFAWSGPNDVTLDDVTSATPSFTAPVQLVADRDLDFTLMITDASGNSAEDTVMITVTANNEAPSADAGPDQTVAEGATVTLAGAGIDPENEEISFAWTAPNDVTLTAAATATPRFTAPEQLVANRYLVFTLKVTDASGNASTPATVTITVTAGENDAPSANAGDDQTVAEGALVTLAGTGSDPENEPLTFAWAAPDEVTLINANTATPSFTAPNNLKEDLKLVFSLAVVDASFHSSQPATVTITVKGVDDPPVVDAGPDQTVNEDDTVTLNGSVSDSEDEVADISYVWSREVTDPTLPNVVLNNVGILSPRFVAPLDLVRDRELIFTLTATDTGGNTATDSVTITVTANNEAPSADAGSDQTVDEGVVVTLDGSGSSDPEGEMLSFKWTAPPDVSLTAANTVTPSFTAPVQLLNNSELIFTLTVSDASGNVSDSDTVTITVTAGPNNNPISHAGPDQTVAEGATVALDGSASFDPEGEALTFEWSAPAGVTLDDRESMTPSFTAPVQLVDDLELVFRLYVFDASGNASTNTDSNTVTITVMANNEPPIADAGLDQTVDEGAAVTLNGAGSSDPEGEVLEYDWTPPSGVTLDDATSTTPNFTAPAQLVDDLELAFTLEVRDASGNAATDTVTITVTAGDNDAPVAHAGAPQTVDEGEAVRLNGALSSDPEGEELTFEWTAPDDVTLTDPLTTTPSFTAPEQLVDDLELEFTLVVTDARGRASVPATVTITVMAGVNDAPVAHAGAPQTVDEGEAVRLNGSGSDPEGEVLSFEWIAPTDVTLDDVTSATPSFTAPMQLLENRVLEFILVITDASGNASEPVTVRITVTAGPNDAPIANAGDDDTVAEGAAVSLDGRGSSDPEGEELTFAWTAPPDVSLTGANTATPSFTAPEQLLADLELEFTLTVSDASNNAATDMVTITVMAGDNDAPVAHAGDPQTVDEGEMVTLNGALSSDPEGEELTFAWTAPDDVTLTDPNTATPSFTAPEQLLADLELEFTLTVSDASNNCRYGYGDDHGDGGP